MNYLLNTEPVSFKDLYLVAVSEGYGGAHSIGWVAEYLHSKGWRVFEKVYGRGSRWVEIGT